MDECAVGQQLLNILECLCMLANPSLRIFLANRQQGILILADFSKTVFAVVVRAKEGKVPFPQSASTVTNTTKHNVFDLFCKIILLIPVQYVVH